MKIKLYNPDREKDEVIPLWQSYISNSEAKKLLSTYVENAKWSDAEVKILMKGIQKHRSCPRKIEPLLPGKTYKQIQNKCRMMKDKQREMKRVPADQEIPMGCKQWTIDEHKRLVEGIKLYGRDNVKLAKYMKTRNRYEVNIRIRYCA